jgi:hypothetical protein
VSSAYARAIAVMRICSRPQFQLQLPASRLLTKEPAQIRRGPG